MVVEPILEPVDPINLKSRILAPFSRRYRNYAALVTVPDDRRGLARNHIMTEDLRLLNIKNPKVATTSIVQLMYYWSRGRFHSGSPHRLMSGVLLARYHWATIEAALRTNRPYTFAFVRHPVDRVQSAFRNFFVDRTNIAARKHMPPMKALGYTQNGPVERNFDIFLDYITLSMERDSRRTDSHWRAQFLNLGHDLVTYDKIGRIERFADDMRAVLNGAGAAELAASGVVDRVYNATSRTMTPPTRAQIARIETLYARDYEIYGY